jgi:hypothetical protein
MGLVPIAILVFAGITSLYYLVREIQEFFFLKSILLQILEKSKIDSVQDLVKIKNYLQSTISYNGSLKAKKRPLLRHSASQTLKSKYGFCGENARVAIKLFHIGGIKARRIYMFRKEWQHVLIEHEFKSNWFMFDGHYDPSTLLTDDAVATILSEEILSYPNDYENNPYLNFCRIKLFYKISFLKPFSKIKLPPLIVYLFESPYLIKLVFILTLIFLSISLNYFL